MAESEGIYFYAISNGTYSEIRLVNIYHSKKYSNKEFAQAYNDSIEALGGKAYDCEDIAEKMVELFGFKLVVLNFEVYVANGYHIPVDSNKVSEDTRFFASDGGSE